MKAHINGLKYHCIPLAIVKHNKHASWVIMEHFIAVTISIANDEVKNARINNIQQQWTSFIQWRTPNIITVMLSIIFPSANKAKLSMKYPTISILQLVVTAAVCVCLCKMQQIDVRGFMSTYCLLAGSSTDWIMVKYRFN